MKAVRYIGISETTGEAVGLVKHVDFKPGEKERELWMSTVVVNQKRKK